MADNLTVTPGTGATVALDEVVDGTLGTVKVQFTKLMDGTLDSTNKAVVTAAGALKVDNSAVTQPVSGTVTANQGTANATPWNAKITDGTNAAAIKAASTAAAAADPAVVVAISPNNYDFGSGTGGSHTQRVIVDSSQLGALGQNTKSASAPVTIASDQGYAGNVGGLTVTQAASSTITRPANTTAYASGQLVANSVTAASVTNLQFTTLARISGGSGVIIGAQIQKSTTSVTNAAFRLHLFNTAPTYVTAGDGSALSTVVVASGKGYLGYIDITAMVAFSDVAWGSGAPDNSRGGIPYVASAQTIFGLLEARGAYTPGSAEVFTVTLDALQD